MNTRVKQLRKELESELRDNNREIKLAIKHRDYTVASHIDSVNGCLEYVIARLKQIEKP